MSGTGIRSREGNAIITVMGATYLVAALALLIIHVQQTAAARTLIEAAVDLVLAVVMFAGAWFFVEGLYSLGLVKRSRALRLRPSNAAVSS
jgi:uncharacterized membrane protein YgdD (TMEM256/DUF423 family)